MSTDVDRSAADSQAASGDDRGKTHVPEIKISKCYHCGTALPDGATVCPYCGRRQVRICYCGNYIPVTAPKCPYCGADWSVAFRVRRKSRSRKLSWKYLIGYAATGALISIAAAAVINSMVGALALRSLPPGQTGLPGSFSARLALALETIGRGLSFLGRRIASAGGGPGVALLIVSCGATAGALFYLRKIGRLKFRLPFGRKRVKKRRRQGVY